MDPVPTKSSTTTLAIHGESTKKKKIGTDDNAGGGILVKSNQSSSNRLKIPTPTWHAPWKLSTVLSSHLVRFQTGIHAHLALLCIHFSTFPHTFLFLSRTIGMGQEHRFRSNERYVCKWFC